MSAQLILNSGQARNHADLAVVGIVGRLPEYALPPGITPMPHFAGMIPDGPGSFVFQGPAPGGR